MQHILTLHNIKPPLNLRGASFCAQALHHTNDLFYNSRTQVLLFKLIRQIDGPGLSAPAYLQCLSSACMHIPLQRNAIASCSHRTSFLFLETCRDFTLRSGSHMPPKQVLGGGVPVELAYMWGRRVHGPSCMPAHQVGSQGCQDASEQHPPAS